MSGDARKYEVVFVLGGPGAGKGTQCERIQKEFGFHHLSAGELLRQERKNVESEFREEIEKYLKDGSIVPVKITCSILCREMKRAGKRCILIDGFPRNQDNLDGWNKEMSEFAEVKKVIVFDCPDKVCIDRCVSRGQFSGRPDDNAQSMPKRIQMHQEETMPVIDHYRALNLVCKINSDRLPDEVFEDVKQIFMDLGYCLDGSRLC